MAQSLVPQRHEGLKLMTSWCYNTFRTAVRIRYD